MKGEMPDTNYRPSNGTEGMMFEDAFCCRCIHEKFMHTQNHADYQCKILNEALTEDWVKEWTYDEQGKPTCTEFKKWDWGNDDDDNGLNEPPAIIPDDPNQLTMPFMISEIEENALQEKIFAE